MGSSINLNLSLLPSYAPKTVASLLRDLSKIDSVSDNLSVLNYYLLKYEEELAMVETFKHELPLCMLLLVEAIETLKDVIMNIKILTEPETEKSMKRKHSENEQMILSDDHNRKGKNLMIDLNSPAESEPQPRNSIYENKKQKTIPHSYQENLARTQPGIQSVPMMAADESTIFSIEPALKNQRGNEAAEILGPAGIIPNRQNLKTDPVTLNFHPKPSTEQIWKYSRRSRTQQLCDSFVVTPKEIRDVMQVEELTTDQV